MTEYSAQQDEDEATVEAESQAWIGPCPCQLSTVCSLATDCTPHPGQPTLPSMGVSTMSCIQTQEEEWKDDWVFVRHLKNSTD